MPSSTFYNEVLTDHNLYPAHKKPLPGANMTLEGVNPSCGDDIILQLKVENGKIEDGSFVGVMVIKSDDDLEYFKELYGVEKVRKIY